MFKATNVLIEKNKVVKQSITCDGSQVTYGSALRLWASDAEFRELFINLLANSDFAAFRWETPPITSNSIQRPFEFVVVNSLEFNSRSTDANSFKAFFSSDDDDDGIVTFANLGGDATLIVPTPGTDQSAYGHLAAFIRLAPKNQIHALWRVIGETVSAQLGETPIWLSTAGGGVAWLHVRLDSTPKYYFHSPFKRFS